MKLSVAAPWVEPPLKQFVDDARVEYAVLLHPSGQVLGQYGFARSVDVMTACALAAAIHASQAALGRMVDGRPFDQLHYAGRERQLFLAQVPVPDGLYLLLAVFDHESSLGLAQLYAEELRARVAAAAPPAAAAGPGIGDGFERDLHRSLAKLFGRA